MDRTGNVFTEVSVDMTLEQTINVPAKYGLWSIMNFSDVSVAVNIWIPRAFVPENSTNKRSPRESRYEKHQRWKQRYYCINN